MDPLHDIVPARQDVRDHLDPGERGNDLPGQGERIHGRPDLALPDTLVGEPSEGGNPVFVGTTNGLAEGRRFKREPDTSPEYLVIGQLGPKCSAQMDHGGQCRRVLSKDSLTYPDGDVVLLVKDRPGQLVLGLEVKVESPLVTWAASATKVMLEVP